MKKIKYCVDSKGLLVRLSAVLMIVSAALRLLGYWGFWNSQKAFFCYTQILLPIVCNILFAVIILNFGNRGFKLTIIPIVLGAAFFMIKAFDFDGILPTLLCILVSVLTAGIYIATLFGRINTKWFLPPLFGLPFLYQLILRDGATILARENAMSLEQFIPELSVLCIELSLLLFSFAIRVKEDGIETVEGESVFSEDDFIVEERKEETPALPVTEENHEQ